MNKEIKKMLFDLKGLPKYQFERRIDIFILEHLEDVLSKKLNEKVHFLYPEFPLRSLKGIKDMKFIDTTKEKIDKLETVETRHNTNVDYLLASEKTFYLVELKTDPQSFKEDSQLIYYSHYSGKKFKDLYAFFVELAETQKKKWKTGLEYLNKKYEDHFKEKLENNCNKEIKIIYLVPSAIINNEKYKKEKEKLEDELGEETFVSLTEFADKISGDKQLKLLLKEIDKE